MNSARVGDREVILSFLREHARTFTRSTIVSVISTGTEFALLPLLVRLFSVEHWIAYAVVQFVGTAITFLLSRYWAFEAGNAAQIHSQGVRYLMVFAGSFVLNTVLPSVGSYLLRLPPEVAFAVAQGIVYLGWNYPLNKYWVFRIHPTSEVEVG